MFDLIPFHSPRQSNLLFKNIPFLSPASCLLLLLSMIRGLAPVTWQTTNTYKLSFGQCLSLVDSDQDHLRLWRGKVFLIDSDCSAISLFDHHIIRRVGCPSVQWWWGFDFPRNLSANNNHTKAIQLEKINISNIIIPSIITAKKMAKVSPEQARLQIKTHRITALGE